MSDMSISDRGKYVLSKHGSNGYARWCLILEMIAQAMDRNKPNVCYREMPINEWCRSLKINKRRLRDFLTDVGEKLDLCWEITENMLKVEAPEMLKLVDDSTKKAQVAKRHSVIVTERDEDKDEDKNIDKDKNEDECIGFDVESSFEEIWGKYLNKDGRKKAMECFISSVKNEDDFRQINLALENYNKSDVVKKGFIKSGGNWFENWKDYLDYKNVSEIQKEKDKKQIEEQRNMLNEAQKEGVPMPENVRQQVRETLEKLKKKSK